MDKFLDLKNNSERIISNQFTKLREFRYSQTDGFVAPNTLYTIYYTNDKLKVYLTGVPSSTNSKKIDRENETDSFVIYQNINNLERENYPKPDKVLPKPSDYDVGFINRYFVNLLMMIPNHFLKYQKMILIVKVHFLIIIN